MRGGRKEEVEREEFSQGATLRVGGKVRGYESKEVFDPKIRKLGVDVQRNDAHNRR